MNSIQGAFVFLIRTLFDLYAFILLLRVVMQYFHVNPANQIAQFVGKMTTPVVQPLQSMVPKYKNLDLASVLLLYLVVLTKWILVLLISGFGIPGILSLFILSLAEVLNHTLDLFFYSILIMVVLSWFMPAADHPIVQLIYQISEPLVRPVRNALPPMGGIDFSPLIVLIGLKFLSILLVQPLMGALYS